MATPRVVRRRFKFLGKLCLIVFLGVVGGAIWALVDARRSPMDLVRMFTPTSAEPAPSAAAPAPPPPSVAATPKPKPAAPPPKPAAEPAPVKKPVPPPDTYPPEKVITLIQEAENHLKNGRMKAAFDLLNPVDPVMAPADQAELLRRIKLDAEQYHRLLSETGAGKVLDPPEVAELHLNHGGSLLVKHLEEGGSEYRFETLSGIRSSVARSRVTRVRRFDRGKSTAAVELELQKQAAARGLEAVTDEKGIIRNFKDRQGTQASPLAFFDLAEFCARNGRGHRLLPLFAEGLRRDPQLAATVHDHKANRAVDAFLYYLSIYSKDEAKRVFDALSEKYRDTASYRDRIEKDPEVKEAYQALFGMKPPPAQQVPPPPPIASGPAEKKPPEAPPSQDPEPPPAPSSRAAEDSPPTELPADAPARAAELVKKGDTLYARAVAHLLNSDQNKNPSGWEAENKKALDLFAQAHDKYYYPAAEVFEKAQKGIPQSLLDRLRHTQQRRALCRKRARSG
ncbi:MAG: hypothetical protein HY716_00960 [Planctomycetes bacterium]|nr:hypothetical protein [Planctomycetota bacterium]